MVSHMKLKALQNKIEDTKKTRETEGKGRAKSLTSLRKRAAQFTTNGDIEMLRDG